MILTIKTQLMRYKMRIAIVEVEQDQYRTVNNITLRSDNFNFENDCLAFGVTDGIIETIQDQYVFGWIDGTNIFGKHVKRTYMLVEEYGYASK